MPALFTILYAFLKMIPTTKDQPENKLNTKPDFISKCKFFQLFLILKIKVGVKVRDENVIRLGLYQNINYDIKSW